MFDGGDENREGDAAVYIAVLLVGLLLGGGEGGCAGGGGGLDNGVEIVGDGVGGLDHVLASGEDVCRMTQEPVARVEMPCARSTPLKSKSNDVSCRRLRIPVITEKM